MKEPKNPREGDREDHEIFGGSFGKLVLLVVFLLGVAMYIAKPDFRESVGEAWQVLAGMLR